MGGGEFKEKTKKKNKAVYTGSSNHSVLGEFYSYPCHFWVVLEITRNNMVRIYEMRPYFSFEFFILQ